MPSYPNDQGKDAGSIPVRVALTSGVTTVAVTALAEGLILKNAPCLFFGGEAKAFATAGFLMLFDSATIPANGAVTPKRIWDVAANSTVEVGFATPLKMNVGAVLVFSTTAPFTKTGNATAFLSGEAI